MLNLEPRNRRPDPASLMHQRIHTMLLRSQTPNLNLKSQPPNPCFLILDPNRKPPALKPKLQTLKTNPESDIKSNQIDLNQTEEKLRTGGEHRRSLLGRAPGARKP